MNEKLGDYHRFNSFRTDLHVHSEASKCSSRPIKDILDECIRNKIECVGIVDHLHEDNLDNLIRRKVDVSNYDVNNGLKIYLGIEIDFFMRNQNSHNQEIPQEFDIVLGAIHWLNNYNVNFFPETTPENKIKGLKPIDLREIVIAELMDTDKDNFFDLYIGTISSLLNSKYIDIWAHPFRTLGFLLIYNENYLDYFVKEYLIDIIEDLYQNNIHFELNEGLNHSLNYRGGKFYSPQLYNDWTKFYTLVVRKLNEKKVPITLGTDSHNKSVKIGGYSWVKELMP